MAWVVLQARGIISCKCMSCRLLASGPTEVVVLKCTRGDDSTCAMSNRIFVEEQLFINSSSDGAVHCIERCFFSSFRTKDSLQGLKKGLWACSTAPYRTIQYSSVWIQNGRERKETRQRVVEETRGKKFLVFEQARDSVRHVGRRF